VTSGLVARLLVMLNKFLSRIAHLRRAREDAHLRRAAGALRNVG
jgi:hypothetical protein